MCLAPHRRPYYLPAVRMEILELRAARGWSLQQTADVFLVTPATIAAWMQCLDEAGPEALVQLRTPVNKFPQFVRYAVQRVKTLCPTLGKKKLAEVLARAGLHLALPRSGGLARRILGGDHRGSRKSPKTPGRKVTAKRPNHVWHVDLTTVPILAGIPHRRQRIPVLAVEEFPVLVPTTRDQAPIRRDWAAREHCAERALNPNAESRDAPLACSLSPGRHRRTTLSLVVWYNEFRPHTTLHGRAPTKCTSIASWPTENRVSNPDRCGRALRRAHDRTRLSRAIRARASTWKASASTADRNCPSSASAARRDARQRAGASANGGPSLAVLARQIARHISRLEIVKDLAHAAAGDGVSPLPTEFDFTQNPKNPRKKLGGPLQWTITVDDTSRFCNFLELLVSIPLRIVFSTELHRERLMPSQRCVDQTHRFLRISRIPLPFTYSPAGHNGHEDGLTSTF